MPLINGSLQIGQSAIRANQAALQVIGNNVANASDPNYSRQRPILEPVGGGEMLPGLRPGLGVQLSTIQRMADEAINARLRSAVSDRAAAESASGVFAQIETLFNALGDDHISARMNDLFNAFTELAADPQSSARRTMVLQAGNSLSQMIQAHRTTLTDQRQQINSELISLTREANRLTEQVAELNAKITQVEFGMVNATAGALRDQRDAALAGLAKLMDIRTQSGPSGGINVYLGSTPMVMSRDAFGLVTESDVSAGYPDIAIRFSSTDMVVDITGGKIGGLLSIRDGGLTDAQADLDAFAVALINGVNTLHAEGQGLVGVASVTGACAVSDPSAALNAAGLAYTPVNGTFQIHLTDANDVRTAHTVEVDLDGIGSDTTLTSLGAALDALGNVSATAGADGRLTITAADGYTLTFSEDDSHVLAALGINTFFSGTGAHDFAVRSGLTGNLVAAATNHSPGDNSNALRLAGLAEQGVDALGGVRLGDHYRDMVTTVAGRSAGATDEFEAADALAESLRGQRDAVSGVSMDEETIELMRYQRAFQGAAHYLALINELLDELVALIG